MGRASFGRVVFRGVEYGHDIVVCSCRVRRRMKELSAHMRSVYGHTPLTGDELKEYLRECGEVEVVFIGTGVYGALPLTGDAEELLERLARTGVEVVKAVTNDELLERVESERRRYLAVIHVTC